METLYLKAKQAQTKADAFAQQSMFQKDKENEMLRELEAKWSKSYEEKAIVVNQLERELACTVDELQKSRKNSIIDQSYIRNQVLTTNRTTNSKQEYSNITTADHNTNIILEVKRLNKLMAKQSQLIASLESNICILQIALSDAEGRLLFRNSQVCICYYIICVNDECVIYLSNYNGFVFVVVLVHYMFTHGYLINTYVYTFIYIMYTI